LKRLLGLTIALALMLGLVVGCGGGSTSGDITVGPMTVSLPDDWQRSGDYEDIISSVSGGGIATWIAADAYEDSSGDILIFIESIDMVAYYELQGNQSWQGWDIELEEADMTKEDYVAFMQTDLMGQSEDISLVTLQPLTVGGHESWESTFAATEDGEVTHICVVLVFAPDSLGVLQLMIAEADWAQFEDTWESIRDSVVI
jgi:hypothetical protein